MKKGFFVFIIMVLSTMLYAQTQDDIDKLIYQTKQRVYDVNYDGVITDLDYCISFMQNWGNEDIRLVECWTSATSFRHLVFAFVWTNTDVELKLIDPMQRPEVEYIEVNDVTQRWQGWIWGMM
jgi:hypothetical protein